MYSASASSSTEPPVSWLALLDGSITLLVGDVVGPQPIGIEHDLILPDHAPDGGNFSHVRHGLQFVFQEPVLQRAQLRQVLRAPCGRQVRTRTSSPRRLRPAPGALASRWQARLHLVQIFEHARARPVRSVPSSNRM